MLIYRDLTFKVLKLQASANIMRKRSVSESFSRQSSVCTGKLSTSEFQAYTLTH